MVLDFKEPGEPAVRTEFSYHMTPASILITGTGSLPVGKDLEAVLRKIEYWHQAPITKFRIMARQGQSAWHGVRWNGTTASSFPLNETDENNAMKAMLLQHANEAAASAPPREINTTQNLL